MTQVTVIGAGPGGLASALLLASEGYEVEVFEKQPYVGGRTSSFEKDGFTFDLGPTFFSMPHILEEIFESAGKNLHDYVDLIKLDPMYSLIFPDMTIRASSDEQKMFEEIERHFPGSGASYQRFMKDTRRKLARLSPILQAPHASLTDYLRLRSLKALPELEVGRSLYDVLKRYFDDDRLALAFTFQSKYLGMSPWDCPGAFSILSFMEHEYGVYHPRGGMNQLTKALAEAAEEAGAVIHTGAGVKSIHLEGKTVTGITLDNGEHRPADHLIANSDFAYTMETMLPEGTLKKYSSEKLKGKKYSCSTFMIYIGVKGELPLDHHTVLFADDYKKNVDEIMQTQVLSEDPSIYVQNGSITDDSLAPEGDSALYILAPVPNNLSRIDWEKYEQTFRDLVIDTVARRTGIDDLNSRIVSETILTPKGWQEEKYVYEGAVFSMAHNLGQMMYFRPHNQFEEIDGLWLTGGGTHPGSGLPTIFESAKITAGLIGAGKKKVGS
ncbi:phytoene desaturase family protein [Alkalicoccus urumqiensis]|uniref:Phytoene desaturase n=1 Tax=Alkalicoccus urumqiensis TaxID=1548213 RepID=A0A2P6MKD8_ALKUR|nr:phytoene desaturase family protein [Alkalicoccus urumqiensis]PRO66750.1 phytoene desaturase [Alkalicoccus urumqiensis]